MHGNHQIEPSSTNSVLACLSLAIDEARLVRSIVNTRDQANRLIERASDPQRLAYLNRKIERLEVELAELRKRARLDLESQEES